MDQMNTNREQNKNKQNLGFLLAPTGRYGVKNVEVRYISVVVRVAVYTAQSL